jgi:hypothetical protein
MNVLMMMIKLWKWCHRAPPSSDAIAHPRPSSLPTAGPADLTRRENQRTRLAVAVRWTRWFHLTVEMRRTNQPCFCVVMSLAMNLISASILFVDPSVMLELHGSLFNDNCQVLIYKKYLTCIMLVLIPGTFYEYLLGRLQFNGFW